MVQNLIQQVLLYVGRNEKIPLAIVALSFTCDILIQCKN